MDWNRAGGNSCLLRMAAAGLAGKLGECRGMGANHTGSSEFYGNEFYRCFDLYVIVGRTAGDANSGPDTACLRGGWVGIVVDGQVCLS